MVPDVEGGRLALRNGGKTYWESKRAVEVREAKQRKAEQRQQRAIEGQASQEADSSFGNDEKVAHQQAGPSTLPSL